MLHLNDLVGLYNCKVFRLLHSGLCLSAVLTIVCFKSVDKLRKYLYIFQGMKKDGRSK